jgi:CHAT domain-containing protein
LEQFSRGILEYAEPNMPPGFWDYAQARRFADFLLPPAAPEHLKTKRRLIISPHRLLHTLPFHALAWDEEHRYLIQQFAVSYTPNLSCLLRRYPAPAQRRLLAMGIRDYQVPGHPLSSLKEAEEEIDDLERLYRERGLEISAWRGVEAGESRMCQLEKTGELGMFTSLHLATHGWNVTAILPWKRTCFFKIPCWKGWKSPTGS